MVVFAMASANQTDHAIDSAKDQSDKETNYCCFSAKQEAGSKHQLDISAAKAFRNNKNDQI